MPQLRLPILFTGCTAATTEWFSRRSQAGYELFELPQETIDLTFGVVTLATGMPSGFMCAWLLMPWRLA